MIDEIASLTQKLKLAQDELTTAINDSHTAREDLRQILNEVAKLILPESPWQPIKTAPTDGTEILVKVNGQNTYLVVAWDDETWDAESGSYGKQEHPWATLDGPNYHADTFSHWMPIPELPR
jgi:hypothetical protein